MTNSETLKATRAHPDAVSAWVTDTWHLWRSDAGAHYATRGGTLTADQLEAGYVMTLDADSPDELERLLRGQPDAPKDAA